MHRNYKVSALLLCIAQLFGGTTGKVSAKKDAEDIAANNSYISEEHRLFKDLLDGYQESVRPVGSAGEALLLAFRFSLTAIDGLDEKEQTFAVSGWMDTTWKDIQLVWDPAKYGGLQGIRIPISRLWSPDLIVVNSKDAYNGAPYHHLAFVTPDGSVFWIPPINVETYCAVDLAEFPFDEHVCSVTFISWTYDETQVNLTSKEKQQDKGSTNPHFMSNSEWELKEIAFARNCRKFPCCEENYCDITYSFTIKRQTTFTTHLFLGPSVVLCLITPIVFVLPPGSGEKMIFGIGVVLADVLLLGELISFVPSAHPNVPLLAKYFLANIIMACFSVVISAIVVGFWDKSKTRISGPPTFLRLLILGPLARLLCIRKEDYLPIDDADKATAPEGGEDGFEATSGEEQKRRCVNAYLRNAAMSEWRQLAIVFDRISFIIYCAVLSILTLSFARYL